MVATENNTVVEVTYHGLGIPKEEIALNQYEVFTKIIEDDLTGTRVVADKPVAVCCGSETLFAA